jgi:hypothetical protein
MFFRYAIGSHKTNIVTIGLVLFFGVTQAN